MGKFRKFVYALSDNLFGTISAQLAALINKKNADLNLHYPTVVKGNKNALQLPIKDWEQIQKDLK
jgi:hypothetical protein